MSFINKVQRFDMHKAQVVRQVILKAIREVKTRLCIQETQVMKKGFERVIALIEVGGWRLEA